MTIWEEEKACLDKGNIWNGKSCEKKKVGYRWSEFQGRMNWYGAKGQCETIGMKLPTVEELKSAYTSGITKSWESDGLFYWSSTLVGENSAKILDIYDGQSYDNLRKDVNYVRCVR